MLHIGIQYCLNAMRQLQNGHTPYLRKAETGFRISV